MEFIIPLIGLYDNDSTGVQCQEVAGAVAHVAVAHEGALLAQDEGRGDIAAITTELRNTGRSMRNIHQSTGHTRVGVVII